MWLCVSLISLHSSHEESLGHKLHTTKTDQPGRIPKADLSLRFGILSFLFVLSGNSTYEPPHEISNNVVCATSKGSDQPVRMRSLIRAFAGRLNIL